MNFYNITITDNDIEYSGYIMIDNNNLIYGTCIYEENKKAKLSGNMTKNNVFLAIEKDDTLIPISASLIPINANNIWHNLSDAEFIYTGDYSDSIIEITSFNKIINDLKKNIKVRTCSNCYYGHYALTDDKNKNMWCELNEFGSDSLIGPDYCCLEHIFADDNMEMDEEDYKRREKIKRFKKNFEK